MLPLARLTAAIAEFQAARDSSTHSSRTNPFTKQREHGKTSGDEMLSSIAP
jgi:hypothetical protein